MSSILLDQPTINNIKNDTLQFGMALILSHLFAAKSLFEKDCANSKSILLSLIGFAVYQSVISKLLVTTTLNASLRVTLDDLLKFSTMLYVSKYIGDYDNLYSKEFGLTTMNLLLGFLLYNSFVGKHLTSKLISDKLSLNQVMAISDLVKFTFVFGTAGLLNKLSDVGELDMEYVKLSLGYVTGLVTYDLLMA
jgi:hypothetical protein